MATKIGRPPVENPKNINIRIRMTEEEANMLENCVRHFSTTKTNILLQGLKQVYADIKK